MPHPNRVTGPGVSIRDIVHKRARSVPLFEAKQQRLVHPPKIREIAPILSKPCQSLMPEFRIKFVKPLKEPILSQLARMRFNVVLSAIALLISYEFAEDTKCDVSLLNTVM